MKWIKLKAGNPVYGAITVYLRKYAIGHGCGTTEVYCHPDTDIDGTYRAVHCNDFGVLKIIYVVIKDAAIVKHYKENE